jgi:hypothetical protein
MLRCLAWALEAELDDDRADALAALQWALAGGQAPFPRAQALSRRAGRRGGGGAGPQRGVASAAGGAAGAVFRGGRGDRGHGVVRVLHVGRADGAGPLRRHGARGRGVAHAGSLRGREAAPARVLRHGRRGGEGDRSPRHRPDGPADRGAGEREPGGRGGGRAGARGAADDGPRGRPAARAGDGVERARRQAGGGAAVHAAGLGVVEHLDSEPALRAGAARGRGAAHVDRDGRVGGGRPGAGAPAGPREPAGGGRRVRRPPARPREVDRARRRDRDLDLGGDVGRGVSGSGQRRSRSGS